MRAEELGYALATASADPRAWATIDAAPVSVASKILGLYLKTTQNLLEHPLKTASALEAETLHRKTDAVKNRPHSLDARGCVKHGPTRTQNNPRSTRPCALCHGKIANSTPGLYLAHI